MKPAPYPADTRAKGWRFELDHERIETSATWALAPAELRPWLLMLWLTAWKQTPCGSLDGDEAVIAARIGMPAKMWAKHRAVLLRGWEAADDGRRYHPTITELVLEMMGRRRSESDRKAAQRAAKAAESHGCPTDVPRDNTGTPAESDTDHRPPTTDKAGANAPAARARDPGHDPPETSPTAVGAVCIALKAAGIGNVSPHSQRLRALVSAGAEPAEFVQFAAKALEVAPGSAFAYVVGAVEGERKRAATSAHGLHRGAMPNRQEALELRNRAVGEEWARKMRERANAGT